MAHSEKSVSGSSRGGSVDQTEAAVRLAASLDARGQTAAAWDIVSRLLAAGNRATSLVVLHARMAPRHARTSKALDLILNALATPAAGTSPHLSSLHFCAANLLDELGRYGDAFSHATQAHALRRGSYDPLRIERLVRDWTAYFTPATLRRLPRATHESPLPVFVVGMPRSGTTLVEQVLASHPQIHGAGEINWIFGLWTSAVSRLSHPAAGLIECLDQFTKSLANDLAAEYLGPLQALSPRATRIIDKLPMNLLNLGLIAILFPQARVIHCLRDPLDTCLSCYLTDFAAGSEFGFDLSATGHLYAHCHQLMSHWKQVLELPVMEVRYEQVVDDLEAEARRMVQFLQLPWDPACLRFYENDRPVATASSAQVHLPIYRRSVGRWRHYDAHLGPLRAALSGNHRDVTG
ncbi:MAG TPA: sulfotransferase [Tepidisphaeraceae bacterium]|jgi:hypothetical protein|nr:sulfotransferase [Tepidisphaeraceae bacterium]